MRSGMTEDGRECKTSAETACSPANRRCCSMWSQQILSGITAEPQAFLASPPKAPALNIADTDRPLRPGGVQQPRSSPSTRLAQSGELVRLTGYSAIVVERESLDTIEYRLGVQVRL